MKEKLLEIFLNDFKKPLDIDELFEKLELSNASDFTLLAKALNELEDEYIIIHNHKGLFAPMSFFNLKWYCSFRLPSASVSLNIPRYCNQARLYICLGLEII